MSGGVYCPQCRLNTYRAEDGGCVVCSARSAHKVVEAERQAERERERQRMGMAPVSKARGRVVLSLDAALEWLERAAPHVDPEHAPRWGVVWRHVRAARKALD